jgi:hypothetical protein
MARNLIRFGISDNNHLRAATWKLWTPNAKTDIYLSCRELRGNMKASMHSSGSWHFGYTQEALEYFETENAFNQKKYIQKWQRPQPLTNGLTLAFRIVTPFSAVTTKIIENNKDIVWIPNCPENMATEIDIFITSMEVDSEKWPGKNKMDTKLIGFYKIENSDTVCVVHWTIPMPDFSSLTGKQFQFFKGRSKADLASSNLRMIIFGEETDGSRTLFDLSVKK